MIMIQIMARLIVKYGVSQNSATLVQDTASTHNLVTGANSANYVHYT